MPTILLKSKEIPIKYETEVLVIGSGMTGVCAAIAASELGKDVILLESSGKLGGNFTRSLIGTINGYTVHDNGNYNLLIKGIGEKILNRMREAGGIGEDITLTKLQIIPYDISILERVLDLLVLENNIKTLFHQYACDVVVENQRIKNIIITSKFGTYSISSKVFVDATGDGDIANLAGVSSLTDGTGIQFPSTSFLMGGVDIKEAKKLTKPQLGEYMKKAVEEGAYDLPRIDGTLAILPNGIVRANMGRLKIDGRPVNPLDPEEETYGEMEGRRQAFLYLDFLRNYIPGYENAFICNIPEHFGVRETRRIKGRYILTEEDFIKASKFFDGVALCAHPIEQHGQGKTTKWAYLPDGEYVEIPFRCLIPENINNLLFGGRCISAEATAQAAVRAGASCMSMGEAIGVAAAMAIECSCDVGKIDTKALRKVLINRGVGLSDIK